MHGTTLILRKRYVHSCFGPNELMIVYVSPRRMSGLAVGIVRGLASYDG